MSRQLLMMEPGDEFLTMDTVKEQGAVQVWKVLADGQIVPIDHFTQSVRVERTRSHRHDE